MEEKLDYHQDLKNGDGIIRARTIGGHLRSWDIPRTLNALEIIRKEWGNLEFPGIYILLDTNSKKVYIGEAKDIVVAQGESQKHNPYQKSMFQTFKEEFDFLLMKKNLITKLIAKVGQEEIHRDELKKILEKLGHKINQWQASEAVIDDKKVYIRLGSPKPKNNPKHWQITFRDIFKDSLQKGDGHLLVPRDGILYIPFAEIQKVVTDPSRYKQNTIDVYIIFKEDVIELTYKGNTINITQFQLIK